MNRMTVFAAWAAFAALLTGTGAEPAVRYPFDSGGTAGICGRALKLDDEIRELDIPEFTGSGNFTISCFVRPAGKTSYQIVLAQAAVSPADRIWWIGYSPAQKRFDFLVRDADNKGQSQAFSTAVDRPGEWIHLAAVCRNGRLAIHATPVGASLFDGRAAGTPARGVRRAASALTVGGRRGEAQRGIFSGEIDELTLWKEGLELKELDAVFQLGKRGRGYEPAAFADAVKKSGLETVEFPKREIFPALPTTSFSVTPGPVAAGSEYRLPGQLASGDFQLELRLVMADPVRSEWVFDLGADGFRFNGAKQSLTGEGNHGAPDFLNRPFSHRFAEPPKELTLQFVRRGQELTIRRSGHEIWRGAFTRDTVGEVALTVKSGQVDLKRIAARGALLRRRTVAVFPEGEAGSKFYRIPALAAGEDGTLYAFAEARRTSIGDVGAIDIAFRRSTDGGANWEPVRFLTDRAAKGFSSNNPSPVADPVSGKVHLFYVEVPAHQWGSGNYRVLHTVSADRGESWSGPRELTAMLPKDWRVFLPGPGHALILKHGAYRGRLVVPGWCVKKGKEGTFYESTLIYSDDDGDTFRAGGVAMSGSDECQLAELPDGRLAMAIRPTATHREVRFFAVSSDGGASFGAAKQDPELYAVVCQNSFLTGKDGTVNYFYPAGGNYMADTPLRRSALTLRRRVPDGAGWGAPGLIYAGRSGYSDPAELPDGSIGVLFEGGRRSDMGGILFTRIAKEEL